MRQLYTGYGKCEKGPLPDQPLQSCHAGLRVRFHARYEFRQYRPDQDVHATTVSGEAVKAGRHDRQTQAPPGRSDPQSLLRGSDAEGRCVTAHRRTEARRQEMARTSVTLSPSVEITLQNCTPRDKQASTYRRLLSWTRSARSWKVDASANLAVRAGNGAVDAEAEQRPLRERRRIPW